MQVIAQTEEPTVWTKETAAPSTGSLTLGISVEPTPAHSRRALQVANQARVALAYAYSKSRKAVLLELVQPLSLCKEIVTTLSPRPASKKACYQFSSRLFMSLAGCEWWARYFSVGRRVGRPQQHLRRDGTSVGISR